VNLRFLELQQNALSGPIPSALGNLLNLEQMRLYYNQLTGPIPATLGSLVNLKALVLAFNQLTGPVPAALGNLAGLEELYLLGNQLSGLVPLSVAQIGGRIQAQHNVDQCWFVWGEEIPGQPDNEDLYLPDLQAWRDADLDQDDLICRMGFTATPETVAADLISMVTALRDAGVLNQGLWTALTRKIDQAMALLDRSKPEEALQVLEGFVQQVQGLTPAHLTSEQAAPLLEGAEALMTLIEAAASG
jgi:uncharacterized membrane protein (UPF0136 family)